MSLLPKFQISKYSPATPATPATFHAESSESSKSSGGVVPSEHKFLEIDEGTIQAVRIASAVLNADIWIILDRSFVPHDGLAIYYAEEVPLLKTKTQEELKLIHKTKLAFPGARVIQEGPERKRC